MIRKDIIKIVLPSKNSGQSRSKIQRNWMYLCDFSGCDDIDSYWKTSK
jgi:hypothetical protein